MKAIPNLPSVKFQYLMLSAVSMRNLAGLADLHDESRPIDNSRKNAYIMNLIIKFYFVSVITTSGSERLLITMLFVIS